MVGEGRQECTFHLMIYKERLRNKTRKLLCRVSSETYSFNSIRSEGEYRRITT